MTLHPLIQSKCKLTDSTASAFPKVLVTWAKIFLITGPLHACLRKSAYHVTCDVIKLYYYFKINS